MFIFALNPLPYTPLEFPCSEFSLVVLHVSVRDRYDHGWLSRKLIMNLRRLIDQSIRRSTHALTRSHIVPNGHCPRKPTHLPERVIKQATAATASSTIIPRLCNELEDRHASAIRLQLMGWTCHQQRFRFGNLTARMKTTEGSSTTKSIAQCGVVHRGE